jgi:hypothetical protein
MALIDSIELTAEDRVRWRLMDNDGGRRAMKHVTAQSTERLAACLLFTPTASFDNQSPAFLALLSEFGPGTNPHWLAARIAETLYDRAAIDEQTLDLIMR